MVKGDTSPKHHPSIFYVGLGLRMQQHQEEADTHEYSSYPCKRTMTSPHFQHFQYHHFGGGGGIGGPHFFNSPNNSLEGEVDMRASFTISQRHELERQNMIFKHLTAYRNPTSQASGMDTEPWRCRRTDGKKWRCTKDVAPDRKFCERHAHKNKKSSRKHVEIQSNNIGNSQQKDPPILETPVSSIGWLMKDGSGTPPRTISQVSTCTQVQKQHPTQSSARRGLSDRDTSSHSYENPTAFQQQEYDQENQETIHWNPYMNNDYYPYFDPKVMSPSPQTSPTRHFIEAWPSDEISNKKGPFAFSSGSRELPLSTLTLSVSSGDRIVEENEPVAMKPQWTMSNISWLNSTGGPLGEALCPGNSGTSKGTSDLPSPHGCGNSYSNSASSCSKGSYEDGNHQFNFFG